jgi:hypothetical protein
MFSEGSTSTPPVGKQGVVAGVGKLDEMDTGVAQLCDVVRRYVGCHAHGNAAGSVGKQIGELRRQNHRFRQRTIIIVAKIDGVFVQALQQRLGNRRQPRFGIAAGRGVVPVDVAKVALPVHQRVTHVEILGEARHRVVNRGISVRVVVAHDVAGYLGRFPETAGRAQPQLAHGIENAAVDRLQTVARVGQRTVHDRAERIGQIALAQSPPQGL